MSDDEIKGLVFGNLDLGSIYTATTSDVSQDTSPTDSPIVTLNGRLIGFGVTGATHTHGTVG